MRKSFRTSPLESTRQAQSPSESLSPCLCDFHLCDVCVQKIPVRTYLRERGDDSSGCNEISGSFSTTKRVEQSISCIAESGDDVFSVIQAFIDRRSDNLGFREFVVHSGNALGRRNQDDKFSLRDSPLTQHIESQAGRPTGRQHRVENQSHVARASRWQLPVILDGLRGGFVDLSHQRLRGDP